MPKFTEGETGHTFQSTSAVLPASESRKLRNRDRVPETGCHTRGQESRRILLRKVGVTIQTGEVLGELPVLYTETPPHKPTPHLVDGHRTVTVAATLVLACPQKTLAISILDCGETPRNPPACCPPVLIQTRRPPFYPLPRQPVSGPPLSLLAQIPRTLQGDPPPPPEGLPHSGPRGESLFFKERHRNPPRAVRTLILFRPAGARPACSLRGHGASGCVSWGARLRRLLPPHTGMSPCLQHSWGHWRPAARHTR